MRIWMLDHSRRSAPRVRAALLPKSLAGMALALFLGAAAVESPAQGYPIKPIQIISPFPPGASGELMARGFAQVLSARLGQNVVVVNRPGAGSTIGMVALAQAPADGYTAAFSPVAPIVIQLHRMKNLPYDRDTFIPLCQTFENIFYVTVGPKSPFQDIQALLAFARANPGKLRYSTAGVGSAPHLGGAELWIKAGVQLTDIPFPAEIAAAPHLLTGEVDLGIVTSALLVSQRLRPLAAFADERMKAYPNVPTVGELGYPVHMSGYFGLFLRADTPAPIVARLESACREVTSDPAYRNLAEKQLQQSTYLDRAAFTARVDADYRSKATLIPMLKLEE